MVTSLDSCQVWLENISFIQEADIPMDMEADMKANSALAWISAETLAETVVSYPVTTLTPNNKC